MSTLTADLTLSSTPTAPAPGLTNGTPKLLLRLEGLAMLVAAVAGYRALGGTWGTFALCFLLPDLSMLGYLAGARIGAAVYNAGHSLLGPTLLAGLALASGASTPMLLAALIWVAHIGFDRLAGYGLKYRTAFFDTHLGRVGRGHAA